MRKPRQVEHKAKKQKEKRSQNKTMKKRERNKKMENLKSMIFETKMV
jgi:hypothetical protein